MKMASLQGFCQHIPTKMNLLVDDCPIFRLTCFLEAICLERLKGQRVTFQPPNNAPDNRSWYSGIASPGLVLRF